MRQLIKRYILKLFRKSPEQIIANASDFERAIAIATALGKVKAFKSLHKYRKQLKHELDLRGLGDQMRNFKVKKAPGNLLNIHFRPGAR